MRCPVECHPVDSCHLFDSRHRASSRQQPALATGSTTILWCRGRQPCDYECAGCCCRCFYERLGPVRTNIHHTTSDMGAHLFGEPHHTHSHTHTRAGCRCHTAQTHPNVDRRAIMGVWDLGLCCHIRYRNSLALFGSRPAAVAGSVRDRRRL